jgi:hypothetical protein
VLDEYDVTDPDRVRGFDRASSNLDTAAATDPVGLAPGFKKARSPKPLIDSD